MRFSGAVFIPIAAAIAWGLPAPAEPVVFAPTTAAVGSPLAIELFDANAVGVASAQGTLVGPDGAKVVAAPAFLLSSGRVGGLWAILLGVGDALQPGSYTIDVDFDVGGPTPARRIVKPLTVLARQFHVESILLNGFLTRIETVPDPVKAAQARELESILATFRPGDVFDLRAFVAPVANPVETAHFGDRRTYVFNGGGNALDIHEGIDLAVPLGTPIAASAGGLVAFAGPWIVTGNTVVLEHLPGVYSIYMHMDRILVSAGDRISLGQEIGTVGQTGLATGPHVHWEVRIAGVAVDPRLMAASPLIDISAIMAKIASNLP